MESDELFFAYSEKGNRNLDRKPKKTGKKAGKAGINHEKVAVTPLAIGPGTRILRWPPGAVSARII